MTPIQELQKRYIEFGNALKEKLTDDVKNSNPTLYYEFLALYNKYMSRSPYEPDIDHK